MKNNIFILFLFSQILAQQDNWTLKSIQSNCPDIGTDEVCEGTPFSEFTIRGSEGDEEDDERWWWVSDSTLGLSNYDKGSNKSGSFKIVVRNDEVIVLNNATFVNRRYTIKIKFRFETKGGRDFLDDIFPQISEDKDGILEVGDDYFVAQLNGGDELSVDIDDEWSGIPSFRLKSQGKIIVESDAKDGSIDDESFLTLLNVSKEEKEAEGIPKSISLDDLNKKLNELNSQYSSGSRGYRSAINQRWELNRDTGSWQNLERYSHLETYFRPGDGSKYDKKKLLKYIALKKLIVDTTAKIKLVEKALEKKELESKLKVLTDFLVTIIEREKLFINTSKFYPIYLYTISKRSGTKLIASKYKVETVNTTQLFSPVNIPVPDSIDAIKTGESGRAGPSIGYTKVIVNNGIQFWVLNKPGIPIYRKIEKSSNGVNSISYSKEGSDEEKIFDLVLEDELKTKYGMYKDISLLPMKIDGEVHTHFKKVSGYGYFDDYSTGSVFSSKDNVSGLIEFKESAIQRSIAEDKKKIEDEKNRAIARIEDEKKRAIASLININGRMMYLLKNPKAIEQLGDPQKSEMIISEFNSMQKSLIDKLALHLIHKEYYETKIATGEPRLNEDCWNKNKVGLTDDRYALEMVKAMCTQTPYRTLSGNRNASFPVKITTIRKKRPTWDEVLKYFGGNTGALENNVSKEDINKGKFDLNAKIGSVGFVNDVDDCLINVTVTGNLKYYGISDDLSEKTISYKGKYILSEPNILYNLFSNNNNLKYNIKLLDSGEFTGEVKTFELLADIGDESVVDKYRNAIKTLIKDNVSVKEFKSMPSIKEKIERINKSY